MSQQEPRDDTAQGPDRPGSRGFSRRIFLKSASVAAAGGAIGTAAGAAAIREAEAGDAPAAGLIPAGELREITLQVNGTDVTVAVEPRTTLLDALRDGADLIGTKKVCDRGACGACTVLLDGAPANSCLTLAWDAVGKEITTIEGIADGDDLHPVQAAFVDADALQCGFCTPGFVMASVACLQKHPQPTRPQVVRELSGNICRCGTYPRIFEAVDEAARRQNR